MLQNLQNFAKFQNFELDNLADFEKCCKFLNTYFLAKIGVDTAENERNSAENLPKIGNYPTGPLPRLGEHLAQLVDGLVRGEYSACVRKARISLALRLRRAGGRRSWSAKLANVSIFYKILQIFGGLVLGYIKTKFCKKICV